MILNNLAKIDETKIQEVKNKLREYANNYRELVLLDEKSIESSSLSQFMLRGRDTDSNLQKLYYETLLFRVINTKEYQNKEDYVERIMDFMESLRNFQTEQFSEQKKLYLMILGIKMAAQTYSTLKEDKVN